VRHYTYRFFDAPKIQIQAIGAPKLVSPMPVSYAAEATAKLVEVVTAHRGNADVVITGGSYSSGKRRIKGITNSSREYIRMTT